MSKTVIVDVMESVTSEPGVLIVATDAHGWQTCLRMDPPTFMTLMDRGAPIAEKWTGS